jgi:hypothetical protein
MQKAADADEAYPETEGYTALISQHVDALDKLASITDESETQAHLSKHIELLEGNAHTGRYFMLKTTEQIKSDAPAGLRRRVAFQLFLVDAACDAANAHFMKVHGPGHATNAEDLRTSAAQGIKMLFQALKAPGDPMQLRPKLDAKVEEYIGLICKRVVRERKRAAEEKVTLEKQRQSQLAAEVERAKARRADERARRQRAVVAFLFVLLALGFTFVQR